MPAIWTQLGTLFWVMCTLSCGWKMQIRLVHTVLNVFIYAHFVCKQKAPCRSMMYLINFLNCCFLQRKVSLFQIHIVVVL